MLWLKAHTWSHSWMSGGKTKAKKVAEGSSGSICAPASSCLLSSRFLLIPQRLSINITAPSSSRSLICHYRPLSPPITIPLSFPYCSVSRLLSHSGGGGRGAGTAVLAAAVRCRACVGGGRWVAHVSIYDRQGSLFFTRSATHTTHHSPPPPNKNQKNTHLRPPRPPPPQGTPAPASGAAAWCWRCTC